MTERGLPIADGAPACPFVAFEDDRDERAGSPDHRHRCYAEAGPAPRALAHQEAYCLSSAFPVCPTFQDWARREAARSRTDPGRHADAGAAAAGADQPQRNPPRNWAAPPPWAGRDRRRSDQPAWDETEGDDGDETQDDPPRQGRGLSGSYADRVAMGPAAAAGAAGTGAAGAAGTGAAASAAAGAGAGVERFDDDDAGHEDRPAPSPPSRPREPQAPPEQGHDTVWDDDDDDADADEPEGPPPPRRQRQRDSARMGAAVAGGEARGGAAKAGRRREGPAPEWERAKPLEAYPTLRARRLPELSIPPILVAAVALALAAAVLFALPGLLGFGGPGAAGSASPTLRVQTSRPSVAPTPVPQPTPVIYVVLSGDTLSRIAGRFGVRLEDLIAANAETLPDPDKLQIGDQLIIPVPLPSELPAATEIPGGT